MYDWYISCKWKLAWYRNRSQYEMGYQVSVEDRLFILSFSCYSSSRTFLRPSPYKQIVFVSAFFMHWNAGKLTGWQFMVRRNQAFAHCFKVWFELRSVDIGIYWWTSFLVENIHRRSTYCTRIHLSTFCFVQRCISVVGRNFWNAALVLLFILMLPILNLLNHCFRFIVDLLSLYSKISQTFVFRFLCCCGFQAFHWCSQIYKSVENVEVLKYNS